MFKITLQWFYGFIVLSFDIYAVFIKKMGYMTF